MSGETLDSRKLQATAYHEAGHAVVALLLGMRLRSVTILFDEEHHNKGLCSCEPEKGLDRVDEWPLPRREAWANRRITFVIAGPIAEKRFTNRTNRAGSSADFDEAVRIAEKVSLSDREAERQIDWLWERANNLLAVKETWKAVEEVAAALLAQQTLTGRAVKKIVRQTHHAFWDCSAS